MPNATSEVAYRPAVASVGGGPNQLIACIISSAAIKTIGGPLGPLVARKYQMNAPSVIANSSGIAMKG